MERIATVTADKIIDWDWTVVPAEFVDPLRRYVEFGIVPGPVLTAALSNRLAETILSRSEVEAVNIRRLAMFIAFYLPADAWGSPEKMAEWEERGGMRGNRGKVP